MEEEEEEVVFQGIGKPGGGRISLSDPAPDGKWWFGITFKSLVWVLAELSFVSYKPSPSVSIGEV